MGKLTFWQALKNSFRQEVLQPQVVVYFNEDLDGLASRLDLSREDLINEALSYFEDTITQIETYGIAPWCDVHGLPKDHPLAKAQQRFESKQV